MEISVSIKFKVDLDELLDGGAVNAPRRKIEQFARAYLKAELAERVLDICSIAGVEPESLVHALAEADMITFAEQGD